MKTGKYYLGIAIVIGILCVPAIGEVEPLPQESKPMLIGQSEPALKEIRQLHVVILANDAELNRHGLVPEELANSVTEKIKEAGIRIAENDIDKPDPNSTAVISTKIAARIPELRVDLEALDIKDSNQVVFHVQTSLARMVHFGNETRLNIKTEVWQSEPTMRAVSAEGMPAAVTSAVLEQVEAFTHAHMAANPSNKRPSGPDANKIRTATKELIEPATEPAPASQQGEPAEHKYAASKSGKVFHKPDCIWIKRIKPENLIYYSSRDEAINSGKKPCKQCNP